MKNRKITIYDLAEQLNISPATVSRGLNNHPSISDATKKRIKKVARDWGYRTNKFAANLSQQKTNTIGVIVPRLDSFFMSSVLAGIEKVANKNGYNLIISQSLESFPKERINVNTLYHSGVDALIISLAYETEDAKHLEIFENQGIPILLFDRILDNHSGTSILIDNRQAGYEATEHLIHQGCKRLLHISGNQKRNVYFDRRRGFKDCLQAHNFPFGATNFLELDLNPKSLDIAMEHIAQMKDGVDGIFIDNDTFAAHCIRGLSKIGYDIPKDIKIVGFNNDPVSQLITPNLTTIDYPGHKMGVMAGESIIGHLRGTLDIDPANTILLKHKLIIRDSTSL